jgi:hypothetical protein
VLSVFNTAAITIAQRDSAQDQQLPNASSIQGLAPDEWLKAVVKGADSKSPRWRHLLLLGGILLGFEGQNRKTLPQNLRKKLESAIVKAVAFALDEIEHFPTIAAHTVVLVLNYTFELLSDWERSQINYDRLLPLFINTAFSSSEGLESGYFLGVIDHDFREVEGKKFAWLEPSPSFQKIQSILSSPLVGGLGPLSRLVAHAVENVRDPGLVIHAMDRLLDFSRTLTVQWRLNKLSEIDPSEETEFLEQTSLQKTLPTLWRLLRTSLFSIVIVLRAVLSRTLNDPILGHDRREYLPILRPKAIFELTSHRPDAPSLATNSLHILRNLSFVTARLGQNASSQHTFVFLAAIDLLAQYQDLSQRFLEAIKPSESGRIPAHPVERCLDLFFLNTAEHFTLVLTPEVNEKLLISAALPYLASGGNNNLLEIFEAAHSVVLAVLAAPRSADMAATHLPYYVGTLFNVGGLSNHCLASVFLMLTRFYRSSRRISPPVNSDSPSKPSSK